MAAMPPKPPPPSAVGSSTRGATASSVASEGVATGFETRACTVLSTLIDSVRVADAASPVPSRSSPRKAKRRLGCALKPGLSSVPDVS